MHRRHRPSSVLCLSLALALLGCGEEKDPAKESGKGDDHGHAHADHPSTPHEGVVAAFKDADGKPAGFLELKLHDDKGDLELWLAADEKIAQPFDASLDTKVQVKFIDKAGKTVELAPRNRNQNEDEDGHPNVRDGKTNYFIFPGETGQDAAWLMGAEFQSMVTATFAVDGKTYTSQGFLLVPHTHAGGHAH